MMNSILNDPNKSYLISQSGKNNHVVIGVPHHAPFGNPFLPTPVKRPADENAGFMGLEIARLLECSYVIACNYSFDVNKYWTSDYSRRIKQWQPEILIEIHGHSGTSSYFDIEISPGNMAGNHLSQSLSNNLIKAVSGDEKLSQMTISGNFPEIYFQATMTKTINTDKWLALHIELPLLIRRPEPGNGNGISELARTFCGKLADSLTETLRSSNIELK